jgi:multidrug transporter EmrE-like cation transporter
MVQMSPEGQVALGIIVGLLSTCVQSIGLTLQRKSHILEDEKDDDVAYTPPYRRRRWQIGMFLFLIANIVGSSIQITTLPLPVLSTLQASGLVFNSILASLILKEAWTWRTVYGTVLVAAGAVLVSFFSAVPEPSHSLEQLLGLLSVPAFLVWFILSLVFVLLVIILTFTLRFCVPGLSGDSPRVCLINGMSFGLISGVLSAHALLLAKSAVELIVTSLTDHKNQFKTFEPWLLVLAFIVLSLAQLYYLHLGLKLISTSVLYPFVFCVYNIVAILDGLIYFRQMSRLKALQSGLIALGTVLLLAGVLALSWRLHDDEEITDQPVMGQAEIPQTVLAPGMGFVGEPDSEFSDSEATYSGDEFESDQPVTEQSRLLSKSSSRSRSNSKRLSGVAPGHSHAHQSTRRRRAATLKEVRDIWDSLGGDDSHYYGTVERPTSAASNPDMPSLRVERQRSKRRRRSSTGKMLEPDITSDDMTVSRPESSIRRSITAPDLATRSRRRRSRHYEQGALFSSLLKTSWWRKDRQEPNNEEQGRSEHEG